MREKGRLLGGRLGAALQEVIDSQKLKYRDLGGRATVGRILSGRVGVTLSAATAILDGAEALLSTRIAKNRSPFVHQELLAASLSLARARHELTPERWASYRIDGVFTPREEADDLPGLSWMFVPAGAFRMGRNLDEPAPRDLTGFCSDEGPAHWVEVGEFWMSKSPITRSQYARFLEFTQSAPPEFWTDARFSRSDQQPVVGVTYDEARAFCEWRNACHFGVGYHYRLPTEAEWEYAARGQDGRIYPWGNQKATVRRADFAPKLSASDFELRPKWHDNVKSEAAEILEKTGGPQPVGQRPAGQSWVGVHDMAGGVWEWVGSRYTLTYDAAPAEEPAGLEWFAFRGGTWRSCEADIRSVTRGGNHRQKRANHLGFRMVRVADGKP